MESKSELQKLQGFNSCISRIKQYRRMIEFLIKSGQGLPVTQELANLVDNLRQEKVFLERIINILETDTKKELDKYFDKFELC